MNEALLERIEKEKEENEKLLEEKSQILKENIDENLGLAEEENKKLQDQIDSNSRKQKRTE